MVHSHTVHLPLGAQLVWSPCVTQVAAGGGVGFNSGVVLMDLHGMRESALYNRLLEGYAGYTKTCAIGPRSAIAASNASTSSHCASLPLPGKKRRLGWIADQNAWSFMSMDAAGGRKLFHTLPCGWNRQTSTAFNSNLLYRAWRGRNAACFASPCRLIHGNEWESKKVVVSLQEEEAARASRGEPTSPAGCREVIRRYLCNVKPFNLRGAAAGDTWRTVADVCCGGRSRRGRRGLT